jgi:threonine/homoserine/homoserine lactone efflux protein
LIESGIALLIVAVFLLLSILLRALTGRDKRLDWFEILLGLFLLILAIRQIAMALTGSS